MNTNNINGYNNGHYIVNPLDANSEDDINISVIFRKAVYHWPLYVLVLALSILGAWAYMRYTKPVYSSSARIYIKDEKKSGSAGKGLSALEDFSLLGGSKLVENEMEVIKSPLILQDVIRKNHFNIRYFGKGRFSEYELYDDLPIKITLLTDSSKVGNYFFNISRKKGTNIEIKYIDPLQVERSLRTRFDQPFTVGKDRFVLTYYPTHDPRRLVGFQIRVDSILQLSYQKATELTTALVNKQSSVFEITYQDGVAKRAADFLNAITDRYNQYTLDDKNQTALSTIKFIDNRLSSLGGELGGIERDVETFKKTRGITEIEESSRLFLEQVKDADTKLNDANIQLSVYDQIDKYVNNPESNAPFTPVLGNVDPALTSLINRFQELQTEKKKLSMSLQPGNPIAQNLDQQISDARTTIKSYIAGYRRNAVTAKSGLQQKVNEIEGLIARVPGYERQYIGLQRQQNVKQALYVFLLTKREESSLSYASNMVDNKVISPAYIPIKPISPKTGVVLAAFLLGGVLLTSGYLYLRYLLHTKITSKKDIEKLMGWPVIAEIFKQDVTGNEKFFENKSRSVLTEQMLNLRSNLKFLLNDVKHTPVILFTSSMSGEGKTFLSAHLGNSLTGNGKKIVMIELDLRKPKLAKSLGIGNQSGLTNFIIGAESVEQIIKKVPGMENLYLIPSGPIPPNPIELIESDRLKELFTELKARFDYIIIDTAPAGLVSDAKSLLPFIDYSLFVIRYNYTPKGKLAEVAEAFRTTSFKKIALIFNGIDHDSSYGYYNYGYSSYGYGYGADKSGKSSLLGSLRNFKKRLV